jgi:hypothetical protein
MLQAGFIRPVRPLRGLRPLRETAKSDKSAEETACGGPGSLPENVAGTEFSVNSFLFWETSLFRLVFFDETILIYSKNNKIQKC